jgi:osmotically-inducible protein OsmY
MKAIRVNCVASAAMAGLWLLTLGVPGKTMAQAPDNSNQNKGQVQTADNQSNAKADRDISAKVRKMIMADKDLSTYAHNVKVITANGVVTLKGPVKSEDEKAKVAELAANVVSADKVTNELTVK